MNEELRQAISKNPELIRRSDYLSALLEKADYSVLMAAILAGDEEQIAQALGVSLEVAHDLGTYLHDTAAMFAESFPDFGALLNTSEIKTDGVKSLSRSRLASLPALSPLL